MTSACVTNEWSAALEAASRLIAMSAPTPQVLDELAQLAVPTLADVCVIATDGDAPRHVAACHIEPALIAAVRDALLGRLATDARAIVHDPVSDPALKALGLRSLAVIPLRARGQILGRLALATTTSTPLSARDLALYESAALIVALFLDNRLTEERLERTFIERRGLEEQLRHAQKMDALGRLAGGVAHDFNNILTAISGYCDLTVRGLPGNSPMLGHAMHILRAAQRGSRLTNQLLAFGRNQVLEPVVVDLSDVVRRAGSMLHRLIGEDITLRLDLDPAPLRVLVDQGQIDQILVNLTVNARDAMPSGGLLVIGTSGWSDAGQRWVLLTVTDHGIGMTEETRARIFDPFFTTKERGKGTGLGLSTVLGIVEQSGGRITVTSTEGVGSTFRVLLPEVHAAQPRAETPITPRRLVRGGPETVVLVEDDEEVREFVDLVLRAQGYHVLSAADGAEALEMCERHPGPIDLLLSDVVMPRMSGRELADRLLKLRPQLGVLHISGYPGDTIDRYGDLPLGAAFLQKPFTAQQILSKVRAVLDGTPNGPER